MMGVCLPAVSLELFSVLIRTSSSKMLPSDSCKTRYVINIPCITVGPVLYTCCSQVARMQGR